MCIRDSFLGLTPYAVADALAFTSVWASLALCILVAVIYALPSTTGAHARRVPTTD